MSSRGNKTGTGYPKFVPPVLKEVGKLAAGVATVASITSVAPTTSSATGNPRNKCALQPGHSLMDWIRLGSSGKDLTGVGTQAGRLPVTPAELALHDVASNAWLAIRGKVYNVTHYLPFHPGGVEELVKGIGKDATTLFDSVHPWVNYESLLQKCLVGPLVAFSPSVIVENLFDGETPETIPKFDWIQKTNEISIIFYTPAYANPLIEARMEETTSARVTLSYGNRTFVEELTFTEAVSWPPIDIRANYETGKVELVFRKMRAHIWSNYGVLKRSSRKAAVVASNKIEYALTEKTRVADDVFLLELQRADGVATLVPISYHVRIFPDPKDDDASRSYTPIPAVSPRRKSSFLKLYLMVKRYPNGRVSKLVCDAAPGDVLHLSKPLYGSFPLARLEKRDNFLLLAAGTGITPMLSVINFLADRRVRKSQSLRLIFCNKTPESIPFRRFFDELRASDPRFEAVHVLSEPPNDWTGQIGHITKEIIATTIDEQLANYPKSDLYALICGPVAFNELCRGLLGELKIGSEQLHVFQG